MKLLFATIFLILCKDYLAASVWDVNVTIAVVEYKPRNSADENAENFVNILNEIDNLDLIIFPEDTLSSNTPTEVKLNEVYCDSEDYPKFMQTLSCAAKNKTTYIVVNLEEQEACGTDDSKCPEKGNFIYNTDVVFDRNGAIVARYRKYNLFGEYNRDQPAVAELVTFTADFGIKFGLFTCFDLLFKRPAQDLVEEAKIDAAIFPTMWFSELPFLTAVQAQQMWSYSHNTSLFAAGANNPSRGSGGTGVFLGARDAAIENIIPEGGNKASIYKLVDGEFQSTENAASDDVDTRSKEMDKFKLITDDSILDLTSEVLNTSTSGFIAKIVCYKDTSFCCTFNIDIAIDEKLDVSNNKVYVYQMVAFSGVRSFTGVYNGGIEICGLIACTNSSLSGCGLRFENFSEVAWPVTFKSISVSGEFSNSVNKTQYPNSLLSSILPIQVSQTEWKAEETETVVKKTFSTTNQDRVLTFGIYGRDFSLDSDPKSDDAGDNAATNIFVFNLLFLMLGLTFNMMLT